jgi:hypothetical protein
MGGWWPWGRSRQTVPESAPAVIPTDPGWRGLAPIQRAIGPITPTASLSGFIGSLTVAHDPGLVSPPPELATEHADRLAVLPFNDGRAAEPKGPLSAAPQRSTRTWAPRLDVQRAALGAAPLAPEPDVVSAPLDSPESPVAAEPLPGSLVESPDPAEQRPVPVVSELLEPSARDEISPRGTDSEPEPVSSGPTSPVSWVTAASAERPLPIQRAADTGEPPARIDAGSTPSGASVPSARSQPTMAPAPAAAAPQLPIQRAADSDDSPGTDIAAFIPASFAAAFELDPTEAVSVPVTPFVPAMSATPQPPVAPEPAVPVVPSVSASHAPPADPFRPADPGRPERTAGPQPAVQRWPEADKRVSATDQAATPTPPAVPKSSPAQSASANAADDDAIDAGEGQPIVVAQRISITESDTTHYAPVRPAVSGSALDPLPKPEFAAAQGLPGARDLNLPELPVARIDTALHDAATPPAAAAPVAPATPPPRPSVQRSSTADVTRPGASGSQPAAPVHPPTPGAAPTDEIFFPTAAVQRSALPVVAPIVPDPLLRQIDAAGPTTSGALNEAAPPPPQDRLVVLPPMRSTGSHSAAADAVPTVARTVIGESPQPVSLQRMFEHTARTAAGPEPTTDTSTATNADPGVCTVTFDSPVVQREPDGDAAPAVAPAGAPIAQEPPAGGGAATAATATTQAGGGVPATTNIQELVNQIYDPLAARLRAELWLDRERAGVLMDLRR